MRSSDFTHILSRHILLLIIVIMVTGMAEVKGQCVTGFERIYATSETNSNTPGGPLGIGANNDVKNASNAVGNDLSDSSSITIPSLFSSNFQKLIFPKSFFNAEKIHVKLSPKIDISLLGGINISIQAFKGSTGVGTPVNLASGVLLNLLSGQNTADIVIENPGYDYDAVQITVVGALVSAGRLDIHAAYVSVPKANMNCNTIDDIITGSTSGVLDLNNGVTSPKKAIDTNTDTYATITQNVALAGYVHLTTLFSSPSVTGDSISVILSVPGAPLLDANVFTQLNVIAYNGNTKVSTMPADANIIGIRLLDASVKKYQFTFAVNTPFDRISIQAGGLLGALTSVYIYDVKRIIPKPSIAIEGITVISKTICHEQSTTLSIKNIQNCTDYKWYDVATNGDTVHTGISFPFPQLPPGSYIYYIESSRQGCIDSTSERTPITVNVLPKPGPPHITLSIN